MVYFQEGSLCGVHCVNTLLQGPFFGPVEMSQVQCVSFDVLSHTKVQTNRGKGLDAVTQRLPLRLSSWTVAQGRLLPDAAYTQCLQLQELKDSALVQRALISLRHPYNVLQGVLRLMQIAQELDAAEKAFMAEGGVDSDDFRSFMAEDSGNVSSDGFFSIQVVLSEATCSARACGSSL